MRFSIFLQIANKIYLKWVCSANIKGNVAKSKHVITRLTGGISVRTRTDSTERWYAKMDKSDPHMTSALGGGGGIPNTDKSTERLCLCECDSDMGVKNILTSYVNGPKV